VPCSNAGGEHYDCQFYVPDDGRSGGAPVQSADGTTDGYLHKGTNWVVCQQGGGRVDYGGHYNSVWAWTLSDGNPAWGWVNAVYASGGDDDGGFGGGVPDCAGAHGAPPGTAAGPSGGPSAPVAPAGSGASSSPSR
jgi:hypothetical protein